MDAPQTKYAPDVPENSRAATTHTQSNLTFATAKAGLPNVSAPASNKLANPGCGGELLLVSVGEGLTSMQVGPVADVAVGTL